jgi:HSP20 family molecular chaperone IbpA
MATTPKKKAAPAKKAAAKPAKKAAVKKPLSKTAAPAVPKPATAPAVKEVQVVSSPFWNIWDAGKEFRVRISIPGLSKKNIKVGVDGNKLTISSSKESDIKEVKRDYILREYNYSSWSRSIALPQKVNAADVKVKYKDGVLKLDLPKSTGK